MLPLWFYDGHGRRILYEVDETGLEPSLIASYTYGINLIARLEGISDSTAYYLYNGHGDVTGLVDIDGVLIGSFDYEALGDILEETGIGETPFKYAGEYLDRETGLYLMGARYYASGMGRWITEDPYRGSIDDPLSLNLYVFVRNSPLIYVDPSGNYAITPDELILGIKIVGVGVVFIKVASDMVVNSLESGKDRFWNEIIVPGYDKVKNYITSAKGFLSKIFERESDEVGSTIVDPLPESIPSDIPPFSLESPDPSENFLIFKRLTLQGITYLSTPMQDIEKNRFGVFDLYTPTWQDNVFISEVDTTEGAGKSGIIEQHHLLPQQFKKQFEKAGLDIEDYKIPLDKADHRLKPDGLHTGENNWNKQWSDFFRDNPDATKPEILNQLDKMQKTSGLK